LEPVFSAGDPVETFRADLASLRERAGTEPRTKFEEDLQNLSNRRYHLLNEFPSQKRRIDEIIVEHQRLAPQLKLRVFAGR
jgi:hypothetical protein